MSQRRMPSGQGPSGMRRAPSAGARPGGPRGVTRPRPVGRAVLDEPTQPHRAGAPRRAARIRAPRKPPRISGRAAVLGLLLLGLLLLYVFPLRTYLAQQATIEEMRHNQAEQRERIERLAENLARWEDDEYVAALARARLKYVREGELLYIVTLPDAPAGPAAGSAPDPWYDQLWTNVRSIDDPVVP